MTAEHEPNVCPGCGEQRSFNYRASSWHHRSTDSILCADPPHEPSEALARAWDEGKAAERAFQNRPRGEWWMAQNPYRPQADSPKDPAHDRRCTHDRL